MSADLLLLGLLVGFGALMGLLFLALHAIAYRSLRRAAARGELVDVQGERVHGFSGNAFGQNPDIAYRYSTFHVPPGAALLLRGRVHPDADYTSIVVYDPLLQSVLPERAAGPTWRNAEQLRLDADGRFQVVLSAEPPSADVDWLDCSAVPRGVVFERHIGAAPEDHTQLIPCRLDELDRVLAS
ncbi:MAG: hypothetical protein H6742_16285 [Alphaproteobacteria bacterium]|nr:hypothetical protein [Alphaproteobacteria bacterium]